MKIMTKIFKALFILTVIIGSFNVYGTNLKYRAYSSPLGGVGASDLKITNMTESSQGSKNEYSSATKNPEGWVMVAPGDYSVSGGSASFDASYYIFAPFNQFFTAYNTGFDTSGGNTTSNNVYYDTYGGEIAQFSDNFVGFSGAAVNIPEDWTVNTDGFLRMARNDSTRVRLIAWKVVNNVRIDVWNLTQLAINEILNDHHFAASDFNNEGIRFSSILSTQTNFWAVGCNVDKSYIDTAWKFYKGTVGTGWSVCERGFAYSLAPATLNANYTGSHKKGASAANEFDNILVIPNIPIGIKREIYINHVDQEGNKLPGFEHTQLNMVIPSGTTRASVDPKEGYQEHYTITGSEQIAVTKSSQTAIGTTTYEFEEGISSTGPTRALAEAEPVKYIWVSDAGGIFGTHTNNINDVLVINMVYSKHVIPPPTVALPELQIIGKLCFINTGSVYNDSTKNGGVGDNRLDYIPSTKTVTPYASGAYPYVVRALKYESDDETLSDTATSTANILYKWDIWKYIHYDVEECSGEGEDETCEDVCTSSCDWYHSTDTATDDKDFTYVVPYKHTWYEIMNFKMYRISKLDVYDNNTNVGGTLFEGGVYQINPSSGSNPDTYEKRFDNSRGIVRRVLKVTFPDKSYDLPDVYVTLDKPSGGDGPTVTSKTAAAALATTNLNAENHVTASNTHNTHYLSPELRITYEYDNDFVELDGTVNMLQRNYRTWSERISLATDTFVRDLDSRKTGIGSANTGNLSYTSDLMSFMRPTVKLTTNKDFTPEDKTVPAYRENGIRELKGKIYYKISTDSKYNYGGVGFDSTDATYTLNNPVTVSSLDFVDKDKAYVNNGSVQDVNKVNVLTPMNFGTFQLITPQIVDHTNSTITGVGTSTVLQKNAKFTITPSTVGSSTASYNLSDTREFIKGYYFTFNFNIDVDTNNDGTYETFVEALTPIYRAGNSTTLIAKTTDSFDSGSAGQLTNSVKIVAISTNITDALLQRFNNYTYTNYLYMNNMNNVVKNTGVQNQPNLLSRTDIVSDSYHAIYRIITTKNIGRIFDFAVTDCTDLAFKDVFRLPNGTNVNETRSVSYYSGYKYWNLYSSNYNDMLDRPELEVGTVPKRILPLGPYKNTNIKYVDAPKMGYRISFDLKTTGYMATNNLNNSRKIIVTPNYYYISKDGKTFDKSITLYYKNSSGNYINFATSGYSIYFKPDDGYRYLRNSAYTDVYGSMSPKLESLLVSDKMTLTKEMMATNNTSFIQSWYGEYKLPNSTIAKSNLIGNVHNNINNTYNDGYIGVRFDIKCVDTGGETVFYDTSDKSSGSTTNTSQWDYEGFMNFKNPGSAIPAADPLRYQLAKDIWVIDNARYQEVKGTVVLFDLDNRAANDFE